MTEEIADKRVTHSEMQCADKCKRMWFFAYIRGLRTILAAAPLRIGSAIHLGLHWAKQRQMGLQPDWDDEEITQRVLVEYDKTKPDSQDQLYSWEIERATIAAMFTGYFWRWSEANDFVIKQSEMKFNLPIINPATGRASRTSTSAGAIDGEVELPDSRLAVIEHKTTSSDLDPDSDYWKRLRIDSQISHYFISARAMGHPVETILYDVIRKPNFKPKQIAVLDYDIKQVVDKDTGERLKNKNGSWKQSVSDKETQKLVTRPETPQEYGERVTIDMGERPDFYFQRKEIPRIASDIEEYQYELWQKTRIMHECKINNRYPRDTTACIGFGRCPYFNLCTTGFNCESQEVPEGFKIVSDKHQELID